ncbi:MAG TPA: choice-of-anchor D domain-containing protein [Bacteroidota bacterium]|nr:choice-of-anchor D domain-containing protein [Bacteroidota bacterium]
MHKRVLWTAVMILFVGLAAASSQTLQPWFDSPLDGQVNAIAVSGNKAYLGGTFTKIGYACGTGALFDTATGQPDRTFPKLDPAQGRVYASIPDGRGGWYVGGNFTYVGGIQHKYLVHIRPDHTVDPWNPSPNAFVQCLSLYGNRLYVGGYFTTIAGQSRGYGAVFDTTTGGLLSWDPKADNEITAITQVGSIVYVGGYFFSMGGQVRFMMGATDTAGTATNWAPSNGGPSGSASVSQILYVNGYLYVCGPISQLNSVARTDIAKLDLAGNVLAWNPGATLSGGYGTVACMAYSQGKLYVGGNFTSIGGKSVTNLAVIDTGTGVASTWNPAPNSTVRALAVAGSHLYVGGDFTSIGGKSWSWLASVDTSTGNATNWDVEVNEDPYTISTDGTSIFAGGLFTSAGSTTRGNLAAIDMTTGRITSWNPNASGGVSALAVVADKVIIGGNFTSLGVTSRSYLAALDTMTGTPIATTTWNGYSAGAVNTMLLLGNRLYLGGNFGSVDGSPRSYLAAIDKNSGSLLPWHPTLDAGGVYSLASLGSRVFTSGFFSKVNGQSRPYAAAFDTLNDSLTAWNPNPSYLCWSMAAQGTTVYLGGGFTTVGGVGRKSIAAVDTATGALLTNFNANFDLQLNVNAILPNGNQIIIGGQFEKINTLTRQALAYLDAGTGAVSSWSSNINTNIGTGTIYALAATPQTLLVGGEIISILDVPTQNFAVLIDSTIVLRPGLYANVNAINFGAVPLGGFKDTAIVIGNGGAAPLNITSIVSTGGPFSVRKSSAVLAPGQQLIDTVRFTPAALTTVNAYIVVTSNDLSSPDSIWVTGEGSGSPILQISAHNIAFGAVKLGQSKDTTVTMTNAGLDTLKITSITGISPVFTAGPSSRLLLPAQSFTDTLIFTPVSTEVAHSAILIQSNANANPDTIFVSGSGIPTTGVAAGEASLPDRFELSQNYPNPFNPSTTIRFALPFRSIVQLKVYNVLGQLVTVLVNGEREAGFGGVVWDATVPSGMYFYRLDAVSVSDPMMKFSEVRKMLLLK